MRAALALLALVLAGCGAPDTPAVPDAAAGEGAPRTSVAADEPPVAAAADNGTPRQSDLVLVDRARPGGTR